MSYKPIDTRRDEYRKYLERTGVMDMFTKVLVKLLSEHETNKPDDAIAFIRQNFGDSLNDKNTIQSLQQELEDSHRIIEELRNKLSQYEPLPTDATNTTTTTTTSSPEAESTTNTSGATVVPSKTEVSAKEVEDTTTNKTSSTGHAKVEAPPADAVAEKPAGDGEKAAAEGTEATSAEVKTDEPQAEAEATKEEKDSCNKEAAAAASAVPAVAPASAQPSTDIPVEK